MEAALRQREWQAQKFSGEAMKALRGCGSPDWPGVGGASGMRCCLPHSLSSGGAMASAPAVSLMQDL